MFVTLDVAVQVVREMKEIVERVSQHDRDLSDQMRRAASSIVLNIAEGQRLRGGNQMRHYSIAHGSASELRASIAVANAWGYDVNEPESLDRLMGLLWGLTRSTIPAAIKPPAANRKL